LLQEVQLQQVLAMLHTSSSPKAEEEAADEEEEAEKEEKEREEEEFMMRPCQFTHAQTQVHTLARTHTHKNTLMRGAYNEVGGSAALRP
jgi:hypothetical protein